jgi:hypothetical protein
VIDLIVSLWLEEEVTGLAADHGDQPADQGGLHGIKEHRNVGDDEADGAQQMQRLIDAAVMIVAMIVPALTLEFRQKTLHVDSLGLKKTRHEANIVISLHPDDIPRSLRTFLQNSEPIVIESSS